MYSYKPYIATDFVELQDCSYRDKKFREGSLLRHKLYRNSYYVAGKPKDGAHYPAHKTWVYKCSSEGNIIKKDALGYPVVTENLELIEEGTEDMTNTLYEINTFSCRSPNLSGVQLAYEDKKFGHKLAVNSQGQWVMEIKGTGEVVAVDPKDVQEVLPYTIGVRSEPNGTIYSYFDEGRKFDLGFYLLKSQYDGGYKIVEVVELDSKSKKASKEFKPLAKLTVDTDFANE